MLSFVLLSYFFFTHSATTEIYTLSLHDALPILYLVLKFTSTGTPAGEPPATRSALESFTLPLVSASPPREDTVPSRRSEEHTSELQSHSDLVCRLLLEKKKKNKKMIRILDKTEE